MLSRLRTSRLFPRPPPKVVQARQMGIVARPALLLPIASPINAATTTRLYSPSATSPMMTFVPADPHEAPQTVPVPSSPTTLLELAEEYDINVLAACGGQCSCTTCSMVIEGGKGVLPEPEGDELEMLTTGGMENSGLGTGEIRRLGCQVLASEELSGLVVRVEGREEQDKTGTPGASLRSGKGGDEGEDGEGGWTPSSAILGMLVGETVVSAVAIVLLGASGWEYGDILVGSEGGVIGAGLSLV